MADPNARWQVVKLERPQMRPYYAARQIGESQWEQLQDASGAIARFETESEAGAAILNAAGARACSDCHGTGMFSQPGEFGHECATCNGTGGRSL